MKNLKEIGRIGQNRYGGVFYEEFLHELRGKQGIKVYKEMADNDDVIGSILFLIKMLVRQVKWDVEPGGDTAKDKAAAEFLESCLSDMQNTWTDTVSEFLSFLTYGWSYHEIVYKRRSGKTKDPKTNSKYNDGFIGWRKMPIRSQDTLYQWEYDEEDNLIGMTQMPPPNFGLLTIPKSKALLFRTESAKDNPEGRSILRNAYRSWYFKRRIQEYEGIGIERELAGLPVLIAPEDTDIYGDGDDDIELLATLEEMVGSISRATNRGVVLPFGYDLKLLSTGGSRQIDTNVIIQRYDTRMAMTVVADFILLGHEKVGSFALSSDKTDLFAVAIGTFLDIIDETLNKQAVEPLIDINSPHFDSITDYPKLIHGDIEKQDLEKLGGFISQMTGSGIIIPDESLEDFVREQACIPERLEGSRRRKESAKKEPDEEDEEIKREEAIKRLGR